LPAEQLAARLDGRFRLLTGGSPAALPQHQTLRATVDWSHALLGEAERALFRRLAVFAGGFSLAAAEEVASDELAVPTPSGAARPRRGSLPAEAVLEALRRLVDHSLVVADREPSTGAARYRLLETVREYAAERLAEAGEEETVRAHHAAW